MLKLIRRMCQFTIETKGYDSTENQDIPKSVLNDDAQQNNSIATDLKELVL